jgi:hypothetical protein
LIPPPITIPTGLQRPTSLYVQSPYGYGPLSPHTPHTPHTPQTPHQGHVVQAARSPTAQAFTQPYPPIYPPPPQDHTQHYGNPASGGGGWIFQ